MPRLNKLEVLNEAREKASLHKVDKLGPSLGRLLHRLSPDEIVRYAQPLSNGVTRLNTNAKRPELVIIIDDRTRRNVSVI